MLYRHCQAHLRVIEARQPEASRLALHQPGAEKGDAPVEVENPRAEGLEGRIRGRRPEARDLVYMHTCVRVLMSRLGQKRTCGLR
jgi:hypothetical protein